MRETKRKRRKRNGSKEVRKEENQMKDETGRRKRDKGKVTKEVESTPEERKIRRNTVELVESK